jgi:hypothetical protein
MAVSTQFGWVILVLTHPPNDSVKPLRRSRSTKSVSHQQALLGRWDTIVKVVD